MVEGLLAGTVALRRQASHGPLISASAEGPFQIQPLVLSGPAATRSRFCQHKHKPPPLQARRDSSLPGGALLAVASRALTGGLTAGAGARLPGAAVDTAAAATGKPGGCGLDPRASARPHLPLGLA